MATVHPPQAVPPGTTIDLVAGSGALSVRDDRLFRRGQGRFCRRLVSEAVRRGKVQAALIDLADATCRIEFEAGRLDQTVIAERFAAAVHQAIPALSLSEERGTDDRRDDAWAAFPAPGAASVWAVRRSKPGRAVLGHGALKGDRALTRRLAEDLAELEGVSRCRPGRLSGRLEVRYDADHLDLLDLLRRVEWARLRDRSLVAFRALEDPARIGAGRRLLYLSIAGGGLVLTAVGLIVPGLPTLPFLLVASYYLARSSPALDVGLRKVPVLGTLLTDWQERGIVRREVKTELTVILLITFAVSSALIAPNPALVALIAPLFAFSLYRIWQLPEEVDAVPVRFSVVG